MWLISISKKNHVNNNSSREKTWFSENFTSVLGKNYHFQNFHTCYASKHWKSMWSDIQEISQNYRYRTNVNIRGWIGLIIKSTQFYKFGKLCGILGTETPLSDILLFIWKAWFEGIIWWCLWPNVATFTIQEKFRLLQLKLWNCDSTGTHPPIQFFWCF